MPLQNFVDNQLPTIKAAWLNIVDVLATSVFASAATPAAARTAIDVTSATTMAGSTGSSLVGFLQSGTGAVIRTMQSKDRDIVSFKDFGVVGDGVTNDTVAINAALTYARTTVSGSLRRKLLTGEGIFLVDGALDFSDISIIGSGVLASTFKLKDAAGAIGQVIKISGGRSRYENFSIDGNLANNAGQNQAGLEIIGGSFWNSYDTVYVTGTTGDALKFTLSGGLRPSVHLFTNFQCSNINRSGIRIDAGRNLTFINADVENVGLLAAGNHAIYVASTSEAARRLIFDNPWIEAVGTATASGDGIRIEGASIVKVRGGTISDYGLTAGGGGHGINIGPTVQTDEVEIDGLAMAGRAASQAGQRMIRINPANPNVLLKNMALAAADLQDDMFNQTNGTCQVNINNQVRSPGFVLQAAGTLSAVDNAGTGLQTLISRVNSIDNDTTEIGTQGRGSHGWISRVAAASLPAGAAGNDGKIFLDTTNNRWIFYANGNRYFVAGTAF